MNDPVRLLLPLILLLAVPTIVCVALLLRRVRTTGGAVAVGALGLPDLLISFFLCGYFALLVLGHNAASGHATAGAAPELKTDQLVGNIVFFLGIIGLIVGFLRVRRISPVALFGLRRLPFWRAGFLGLLLLMAVYPFMQGIVQLVQAMLQEGAREQDVVKLYREVTRSGDREGLALMLFVAVIFQPIVEETIFRGYFYATFKCWAGGVASAVFTATLFAAIHMNIVAFPSLLVLALLLTLAYEWSGSLLVPIAMHMAFNGVQLALFTWQSQQAS